MRFTGPKLRVRQFENDEKVLLEDGRSFHLTWIGAGSKSCAATLSRDSQNLNVGDTLLLDDGKLRMELSEQTSAEYIPIPEGKCKVIIGGLYRIEKE